MTAAVFGLLLPVAATWLVLLALRLRTERDSAPVTAAVSVLIGLGLSSVTTFWCALLGVTLGGRFAVVDALAWTAIAVAASLVVVGAASRRPGVVADASRRPRAGRRLAPADWLVRAAFAAVAAVAVATIVAHTVAAPHGEWDAWAIWNQKARFFSRDIAHWANVLDVTWSNPSHPLLVSLSVARLWAYAGSETTLAPTVLGGVWAAGAAALVIGALDPTRRRAWIAGAVLVAPATYTRLAAAQTADLAIGFFLAATLVLLRSATLATTDREMRANLFVAGLVASLAAWTKNEGLVLMAIGTLIVVWTAVRGRRAGVVLSWLAGAAPVCATVLWHKLVVAPVAPEYMTDAPGAGTMIAGLFDPALHATIWTVVEPRWIQWAGPFAAGVLPLTVVAAVLAVLTPAGRTMRLALAAIGVMSVSYYAIWVVSPLDRSWLVATTFDRLVGQLWPSLVLVAFSAGAGPAPPELASSVHQKG